MAALIDRGEFGEGVRLPAESELAARFGVSRPVIREALSRLRVMGVIVSRKGSGSYVQKRADRPRECSATIGFGPLDSLAQVRKCYEFRVEPRGRRRLLRGAEPHARNASDACAARSTGWRSRSSRASSA